MSVIPKKKDYKNVGKSAIEFPPQLAKHGYELVSHVSPTEKSHFDRFGLVKSGKRVIIVYDVKAAMLSITAFDEQFGEVCSLWEKFSTVGSSKDVAPKAVKKPTSAADQKNEKKKENNIKSPKQNKSEQSKPQQQNKPEQSKPQQQNKSEQNKPQQQNKPEQSKPQQQIKPDQTKSAEQPLKNDFSLKKYTVERFDSALKSLKNVKIKYKLKSRQGSGAARVDVYEVSEGKNKLTVTYMPEKQVLQIQGKATDFSRSVQTYFSEGGDYKSAVKAHIEQKQTDEKAADVEKRLKKYLPIASSLLSAQAKIDFSIGIVDLLSGNIVLSDYSSLLIPPYRGLEKFIFDLEQAQGIKVKMVGQAYEKNEEGAYVLKALYRKRIGSIVYAEVMAALYTEYNSTRNYYVHSGPQMQNKVINDKNQAIAIYENMLAVVEYNAKKLREIGFTMKK
ncbi:MAG: hypothetical protein ACI4SC_02270 [Candidatus Neoclostridium sp.]